MLANLDSPGTQFTGIMLVMLVRRDNMMIQVLPSRFLFMIHLATGSLQHLDFENGFSFRVTLPKVALQLFTVHMKQLLRITSVINVLVMVIS